MDKNGYQPDALRAEMRQLVRVAAEPAEAGELVKAAIRRAARVLGLTYSRTKRYWYGEIEVPPAHEVDAIRAKLNARDIARSVPVLANTPAVIPASGIPIESSTLYRLPVHVVYDENGRVWSARSAELREVLGVAVADFDVCEYAVRNFGWIEVKTELRRIHVKFSPRMAQGRALEAVYDLLTTSPNVEVSLNIRSRRAWEHEAVASNLDAAARINELVNQAELEGAQRFVAARQPLAVLFRDQKSSLADVLTKRRHLLTEETPEACMRFAEADPTGLTCVSLGDTTTPQERVTWTWKYVGRGLRFYTAEERSRLIGSDFRKTPDRDYGEWCTHGYDRAAAIGDPIVEDVRALVFRRHGPPIESRYRRLLMPLKTVGGRHLMLVTSELTPH
jgi:hypothetical protein